MSKKNILLIGNSRSVLSKTFEDKNIEFEFKCRFNHDWAKEHDKYIKHTGSFDALVVTYFSHDKSMAELHACKFEKQCKRMFIVCPNKTHKDRKYKYRSNMVYEEIEDKDFEIIDRKLKHYNFNFNNIPRTGLSSILWFNLIKDYNVYVIGFDLTGTDDCKNQHIKPGVAMDTNNHNLKNESMVMQQLLKDGLVIDYNAC
jgi:hypothetical protein